MTLEQVKALTDEELRIKVAELLGCRNIRVDWDCFDYQDETGLVCTNPLGYTLALPDYPRDLNACAEFEQELTDVQFCKYVQILCGHTTRGVKIEWTGPDAGRACRATARQRCEAFVLTTMKGADNQ